MQTGKPCEAYPGATPAVNRRPRAAGHPPESSGHGGTCPACPVYPERSRGERSRRERSRGSRAETSCNKIRASTPEVFFHFPQHALNIAQNLPALPTQQQRQFGSGALHPPCWRLPHTWVGTSQLFRYRFTARSTWLNIAGVSRPVWVFCWLEWKESNNRTVRAPPGQGRR